MPKYSVEFERVQFFVTQVEADSEAEATVLAEKMTRQDVLGCHSYDADLELNSVDLMEEETN